MEGMVNVKLGCVQIPDIKTNCISSDKQMLKVFQNLLQTMIYAIKVYSCHLKRYLSFKFNQESSFVRINKLITRCVFKLRQMYGKEVIL